MIQPNQRIRYSELNTVNLQDLAQNIYALLYTGIQAQINNSISNNNNLDNNFEMVASPGSVSDPMLSSFLLSSTPTIFVPTGSTQLSPYGTSIVVSSPNTYFLPALYQTGTIITQLPGGSKKTIRLQDARGGNATVILGSYNNTFSRDLVGSAYGSVVLSPTQTSVYLTLVGSSNTGPFNWQPDALTNMKSSGNLIRTSNISTSPFFGFDVACDGSGKIAVIGQPGNTGTDSGTVYILNDNGSINVSIKGTNNNNMGQFVASNINATTIVVGAPGISGTNNTGTVYVFQATTGNSNYQQIFSSSGSIFYGYYCDISADANNFIVGSPSSSQAFVYTKSNSTYSLLQTLSATGEFGYSVAIAGDKSAIVVGNPSDNAGTGSVTIYTQTATGNYTFLQNIVGTGALGASNQGSSLTLSGNGQTLVCGGPNDNSGTGASWVFQRTNTIVGQPYTNQQKLVGFGPTGPPFNQGFDCTLSGDGNSLIIDAPTNQSYVGGAFIFNRPANTSQWSQSSFLTSNGLSPNFGPGQFGFSVALNSNGSAAVLGAPFEPNNGGTIGDYYSTF
jgi:hypothetical protein